MENTEQTQSKVQLIDAVTDTLAKAKAIVHLMYVAAADKNVDHDPEIFWAEHIHRDLIDEAARQISQLSSATVEASA